MDECGKIAVTDETISKWGATPLSSEAAAARFQERIATLPPV